AIVITVVIVVIVRGAGSCLLERHATDGDAVVERQGTGFENVAAVAVCIQATERVDQQVRIGDAVVGVVQRLLQGLLNGVEVLVVGEGYPVTSGVGLVVAGIDVIHSGGVAPRHAEERLSCRVVVHDTGEHLGRLATVVIGGNRVAQKHDG